jgi:type I restriction enzyme S subunit
VVSDISLNGDLEKLPSLPQGWVLTKLDELTLKITDGEHFSPKCQASGTPFLSAKDVRDDKENFENAILVDEEDAIKYRKRCDPEKGDILMVSRGATVGRSCIIQSNQIFCLLGSVILIKINKNISNSYLLYSLKSHKVYKNLINISGSTAQQAIYLRDIKNLQIPLPPLPEQHRIVTKIEELFTQLDAGVASLKKVQAQLKRYRQAVLKSAFEGRLTQEWREQHKGEIEPADVLLHRIIQDHKNVEKGKRRELLIVDNNDWYSLPSDWIWTNIGTISNMIHYGYTASASQINTGVKLLRITDIQNNSVNWNTVPYCEIDNEVMKKYLLKEGDIVFARTGATVGKSFLITKIVTNVVFASYLIRILLNEKIRKKYVYYFFQSLQYWIQIHKSKLGIGQPNVNSNLLSKIIIPVSSVEEQSVIVSVIERHFSIADEIEKNIETSLKKAETLRQSILKRAFEGKLVPQDPTDEPASVLLERIKAEKAKTITKMNRGKRSFNSRSTP